MGEMKGATSVPKSVLQYEMDKGLNSILELKLLFPLSKMSPNKSRKRELNNFYCVVVVEMEQMLCS